MKNGISPDAGIDNAVVVIGADGFIGSAIVSYLKKAGWNVVPTVYQRPPADDEVFLDVTDPDSFANPDRLVPGGGFTILNSSGLPDQSASAGLMRAVHVKGMRNIINWAKLKSCRHVVQLSSVSVYGNAVVETGHRENNTRRRRWNPLLASLPYGRTKARAEALLEKSGLPWTALRLPAVFGPGDSFLTGRLRDILVRCGNRLPSDAGRPVSILPVDNAGPLADRVLHTGPLNAARNAAGAHVPWKEIVEEFALAWDMDISFTGRARIRDYLNFADPGMQMMCYYSSLGAEFPDSRLRKEVGWEPEDTWRQTVRNAALHHPGEPGNRNA